MREGWIENRKRDLLPVPYFHVVFTVPDRLNHLFMQHPSDLYNLLFASVWETISQFSLTKLHAETGMVAVLHTWGQNLSLHPHIHCVVPGGGTNYQGHWKQVETSATGKVFLFPVKNLSKVFRGKFMAALVKRFPQKQTFLRDLYRAEWVVYAKEPFAGPDQVLRRFCQHILPKGFVRIRHYGLLSSTRRTELRALQMSFGIVVPMVREKKNWKQICKEHLRFDPDSCPFCGKGRMATIEVLLASRPPTQYPIPGNQEVLSQNIIP